MEGNNRIVVRHRSSDYHDTQLDKNQIWVYMFHLVLLHNLKHKQNYINPIQTNGIFHKATHNKVRVVDCIHRGVTGHN